MGRCGGTIASFQNLPFPFHARKGGAAKYRQIAPEILNTVKKTLKAWSVVKKREMKNGCMQWNLATLTLEEKDE